jgi:hypothetical protein
MPRISGYVSVNGLNSVGWFMDLGLEYQQHLGTMKLGDNVGSGEEPIYLHSQFKAKVG